MHTTQVRTMRTTDGTVCCSGDPAHFCRECKGRIAAESGTAPTPPSLADALRAATGRNRDKENIRAIVLQAPPPPMSRSDIAAPAQSAPRPPDFMAAIRAATGGRR
jgi:hypothetical protein